jgi:hypothetical protein
MTNLLQFTINVRKIPPSISVHFATRVRRSRVVRLNWSLRSFIRAAASKMRASYSSRVATFLLYASFFIQPHKPKSKREGRTVRARFKQLYLGNSSELDICAYDFFSHNDRYNLLRKYGPFLLNHPVCFIWFLILQTAIISLNSINWVVCVVETNCFPCDLRAECLCNFR